MKFCKDCDNYNETHWGQRQCDRETDSIDPISGDKIKLQYSAINERSWPSHTGACGKEAVFFIPKPQKPPKKPSILKQVIDYMKGHNV